MDVKVYEWLGRNIKKYIGLDEDAEAIISAYSALFSTEYALVESRAEELYKEIVDHFYNNILGYKNGLANKGIVSEELDCYFIETSDGMIPIGYYREVRPVEASMLVNKFVEMCEKNIPVDEEYLVTDWNTELESIRIAYEEKMTRKHSSIAKCIISLAAGFVAIVLAVVAFFMAGGFGVLTETLSRDTITLIQNQMPCLGRASASEIIAFARWMIIFAVVFIGACGFFAWELKLAINKKTADDLLENTDSYASTVEAGVKEDIETQTEYVRAAARQGNSLTVSRNRNADVVDDIKRKFRTASKYIRSFHIYSHPAVLAVIALFIVVMPICFTDVIPAMVDETYYKETVSMMEDGEYDEAIDRFKSMEDYKDSKDYMLECQYRKANALLSGNEIYRAKILFGELGDYKDSKDMILQCDYQSAVNKKTDGDLMGAYNKFEKLGSYKDSEKQLEKIKGLLYDKGVELYHDGDYDEAKNYFEKTDGSKREADYITLIDAHNGNLSNIAELYHLIDFEDTKQILLEDDNILDFLLGRWSNSSGKYIEFTKTGPSSHNCSYNIPWTDGKYFKIEGGVHYKGSDDTTWRKQWDYAIVNANTIQVYCYKDYNNYTLYRN